MYDSRVDHIARNSSRHRIRELPSTAGVDTLFPSREFDTPTAMMTFAVNIVDIVRFSFFLFSYVVCNFTSLLLISSIVGATFPPVKRNPTNSTIEPDRKYQRLNQQTRQREEKRRRKPTALSSTFSRNQLALVVVSNQYRSNRYLLISSPGIA